MNRSPCKRDCPDRSITCHAECEKYKAFQIERAKEKEWIREQNNTTSYRWERAHLEKVRRKARGWDRKPKNYD